MGTGVLRGLLSWACAAWPISASAALYGEHRGVQPGAGRCCSRPKPKVQTGRVPRMHSLARGPLNAVLDGWVKNSITDCLLTRALRLYTLQAHLSLCLLPPGFDSPTDNTTSSTQG